MKKISILLACAACAALAQDNPLSASAKAQYMIARGDVLKAAEKMPEANYSFKATDDVRSFGQLVGHVANASYFFCSSAKGEKSPAKANIEKTMTTKAALVEALSGALSYCDGVYDGMTDKAAVEPLKLLGQDSPRIGVLTFNNMHTMEHYGNMVTYMRLKNIVPPSSEPKK
jgi:uncharacterized damage-inducible protein DinB